MSLCNTNALSDNKNQVKFSILDKVPPSNKWQTWVIQPQSEFKKLQFLYVQVTGLNGLT